MSVIRDVPDESLGSEGAEGKMTCPDDDLDKPIFSLFDSLLMGSSSTTKSLRSFMANDKSCKLAKTKHPVEYSLQLSVLQFTIGTY